MESRMGERSVMDARLDHLVVTAPSLEAGVAWVQAGLGVTMQRGGRHPGMGTHNALLRLGDRCYLEVIAIDPNAPAPKRPRWFGLDAGAGEARPRLCGWVASTTDIHTASAVMGPAFGSIEAMSRDAFAWRITIPPDGSMPFSGVAPMLIQWDAGLHPCAQLEDRGCSLLGLEGFHPDAGILRERLSSVGFSDGFVVSMPEPGEAPYLVAHLRTPGGPRRLTSQGALRG